MGTSHTWGELNSKLRRLGNDFDDLPKAVVPDAALHVKTTVLSVAPDRLRNMGKRGVKLAVRYNTGSYGDGEKALVFATPKGPWKIIEEGAKPHRMPRSTRRRRGKRRVVVIPGVGVRAYANHPGMKGKHPWARGVEKALPGVDRILSSKADLVVRRIF